MSYCGLAGSIALAQQCREVADSFEKPELDLDNWWLGQLSSNRYHWIDSEHAKIGDRSLAIRLRSGDFDEIDPSERQEIRIANDLRCRFGDDVWYSFSFRIEGDVKDYGSLRKIIGQWKQEGDGSPLLAQRINNRVFHITTQDNECRFNIAKAAGDPFRITKEEDTAREELRVSPLDLRKPDCDTDLKVEYSSNPTLPDPFEDWVNMTYRLRGDRNGKGLIEIWANERPIARVTGSIGYDFGRSEGGKGTYFKMGLYRDQRPGSAVVYFDDFKRWPHKP